MSVEEFHLLALDTQSQVLREVLVTRGILNSPLVHPREVFRPAIAEAAAGIIVVHNHPSGDPTPSAEDRAVTRQLVAAGQLLDRRSTTMSSWPATGGVFRAGRTPQPAACPGHRVAASYMLGPYTPEPAG